MQSVILKYHALRLIPSKMLEDSIADYVDNNGQRNWNAFNSYLLHSLVLQM